MPNDTFIINHILFCDQKTRYSLKLMYYQTIKFIQIIQKLILVHSRWDTIDNTKITYYYNDKEINKRFFSDN